MSCAASSERFDVRAGRRDSDGNGSLGGISNNLERLLPGAIQSVGKKGDVASALAVVNSAQ